MLPLLLKAILIISSLTFAFNPSATRVASRLGIVPPDDASSSAERKSAISSTAFPILNVGCLPALMCAAVS